MVPRAAPDSTPTTRVALLVLTILTVVAGCEGDQTTTTTPGDPAHGATSRPASTAPAGPPGSVRGVVTFRGNPPPAQSVESAKCHNGAEPIEVKPVVVDAEGRLRDVVVFLKSAPPGAAPAPAAEPAVLDQVNCRYVPAAVALRVGQVLRVRSSDPTLHNVHMMTEANDPVNLSFTKADQVTDVTFQAPESFNVRCDVHQWMTADVHVFAHPHFAVTGGDGSFEIKNLPAGEHTLVFRHGFLGDREQKVTVTAGGTARADQVFGRSAR